MTAPPTNLARRFAAEANHAIENIRIIASPYRIAPIGAHIDHQGGPVLGMTINAYTLLACVPGTDDPVRLHQTSIVFGQLMNASCKSSIEDYECGSQPTHDFQHIVSQTRGVFGSRFSGGGFGGCGVGLVAPQEAVDAVDDIYVAYQRRHPEVAEAARVYLADSVCGLERP